MNLNDFMKNTMDRNEFFETMRTDEDFFIEKFKELKFKVRNIPFFDYETDKMKKWKSAEFWTAFKNEFSKSKKKWIKKFFIIGYWNNGNKEMSYPTEQEFLSLEQAIEYLVSDYQMYKFFSEKELFIYGHYILNRDLKKVIIDNGKMIVI